MAFYVNNVIVTVCACMRISLVIVTIYHVRKLLLLSFRGCSYITLSIEGGEGVSRNMTNDNHGVRGVSQNITANESARGVSQNITYNEGGSEPYLARLFDRWQMDFMTPSEKNLHGHL